MLKDITRSKLIQIWFVAVALLVAAGVAMGMTVTFGTGALLVAGCLVPPAIVFMLWPGVEAQTAGDVLRGDDRRR
jgi:hypothetical protein